MKIVVLAGGLSTERQVSLTSGTGVCRALRERGHKAILVDMFLGFEDYEGKLDDVFDAPDGFCGDYSVAEAEPDLAAVRASRSDKTPIDKLAPLPHVTAEKGDGCWCVRVVFTLDFIEKTFGRKDFATGDIIKGNFYKCGDDTEYPHFGMWSPVELPAPDFHRPEFFGELVIE